MVSGFTKAMATVFVTAVVGTISSEAQTSPQDLAAAVRAEITPDNLSRHARAIVQHERPSGSAGENAAIDYIVETLRAVGEPVEV